MIQYTITRDDITNSMDMFTYSKMEMYHTVATEDGRQICDKDISGYMILNCDPECPIHLSEYDDWQNAVDGFIEKHNIEVKNGKTGNTVEFEITDIDSRSACTYIEKINGKKVKEGTGFYKNLNTKDEKDAWIKAVKQYKKDNGIPTPSSSMKDTVNGIKTSISSLDKSLLGELNPIAPLIITAIPKLVTDPCEFLSFLSQAGALAIPLVSGIPQPFEMASYAIKSALSQIPIDIQNACDSAKDTTQGSYNMVDTELTTSEDYFSDLDALYDEYVKSMNNEVVLFETVLEPKFEYNPSIYLYENGEPDEYNYNMIPGYIDTGTYEMTSENSYKELTLGKIYDRGKPYVKEEKDRMAARFRINEALKNFWVPVRKAWETYAIEQGLDPTWIITSGFRPPGYVWSDGKVQPKNNSAHTVGWAIDIQPMFKSQKEKKDLVQKFSTFVYNFLSNNKHIKFDQILIEYNGNIDTTTSIWAHLGYKSPSGQQRSQYWPCYKNNNVKADHGPVFII